MAVGHGGQVLVSEATRALLDDAARLRDLGEHRLKDLSRPQRLYQLELDGLPDEFPPLATLDNRPTNLPAQPNAFIGRERELAETRALLDRDDVRLLTLTGPGGTGKTRLALQVAADVVEQFPNGVFFVSLAPDPRLGAGRARRSRGRSACASSRGRPPLETLTEYLREKELLLAARQLRAGASPRRPQSAGLLAAAPGAAACSSRAGCRCSLSGERAYRVPPLALPDLRRPARRRAR